MQAPGIGPERIEPIALEDEGCRRRQRASVSPVQGEHHAVTRRHRERRHDGVGPGKIEQDRSAYQIEVPPVVRDDLIVPGELPRGRIHRNDGNGVEVVAGSLTAFVYGPWIPDAGVHQIELRIVGTRAPCGATAVHPCIAVLRPRLRSRFTRRGNRVATPQLLAGLGIPAVEESARGGFAARHPGDEHAIGDNRRAGSVVAFLRIGKLLIPDLLAGLHVEREHVVVDRHAEDFAVVNRRRASRDRGALNSRLELHRRTPQLATCRHIDGERRLAVDDVHDTVVDRWRSQLTHVVHQARVPDRHESRHRLRVDLIEGAVAAARIAHALCRHVIGIAAVVDEFVGGLPQHRTTRQPREDCQAQDVLHINLPKLDTNSTKGGDAGRSFV